ncbi:MAG: cryptochrome/photolyase family protein [Pseudonocardia sp.]|uniref:cryptochrome/photolyase family protein n=1 Tax=unclassified Pseudonocardia TaxID=2619320 RepID=UPI000869066C|nr:MULTISPECIES: cryptochrome/photolyase family protein [unclassified Pseudonocardia]MBN9109431.1 cryptochrome/photolyase family protein [Pseudonocardia sp.]ODU29930.1 MAG: deoxyribodipyrimidine photolyase [Pseudonocardia sp. SCN 72-51]ODV08131.1 MAG: deoxyribodipyrimidine photolyase [Pseudonocardia sp. SCN 73-27]
MEPLLVFADQLGRHVHSTAEHRDREVILVESSRALGRRRYHRQKLHLVLSGLRHLADELGDRATLLRTETYREALEQVGRPVVVHEPTSHAAADLVERLRKDGLVAEILPTPTFALPRKDFTEWAGDRETFRMEDFYRAQRTRFDVLMDGEQPVGGKWNHDHDNREPPPKGARTLDVRGPWTPTEDDIDSRVRADLDATGYPTVGEDGPRLFAVTHTEARKALRHFVRYRLPAFGPYEDAMLGDDWAMAHSLLSVPLNMGVLHPLDAVHAAEQAHRDGDVPIAPAEGFVRQILGWREYVWQLYWRFGKGYLRRNALRAHAPLPDWWADLDADAVTANCLRTALEGVRDRGWTHHIQRLMILGNHALQRGYQPRELTEWFATAFVDGYAWVMPPNVVGMSQHADGGMTATKPYSSGGAYVNRMSDHCRDCAFDPRKRLGDDACPYTAGYWAWLHRHADLLADNHRTARAVASMHRLDDLGAVLEQESARESF